MDILQSWASCLAFYSKARLSLTVYHVKRRMCNHPQKMSQDEYDKFLDFLQDKEIISEEDKKYVNYYGLSWDRIGAAGMCYSPEYEIPVHNYADGNVLAYVRYQSSLIYDPETADKKRKVNLYKKLALIMTEMVNG